MISKDSINKIGGLANTLRHKCGGYWMLKDEDKVPDADKAFLADVRQLANFILNEADTAEAKRDTPHTSANQPKPEGAP